ncbi:MAG: membrane protein insertase YidC [Oscillospiraceae bacterium]
MTWLYSIIGTPLGYILYFIYEFICSNVGVAIIIFTLIVKLALLPISIKQQKTSAKTSVFQPKVLEIQQKYRNNQQKQQEELMKLQQQGYKPYSGCLPMLLSFLILFGVIDVVYKPMTHIVHLNDEAITSMVESSYSAEITSFFSEELAKKDGEFKKDSEKERNELILKDAQRIVDYYNEKCLKDGASACDISVFETVSPESVELIHTVFITAIEEENALNPSDKKNKQKLISDTDLYKITDDEQKELDALESDEAKTEYRLAHSFAKPTTDALTTYQSYYGAYSCASKDGAVFTATKSLQKELYSLERFGALATEYGTESASRIYSSVSEATRTELLELYDNLNFLGIPLGQVPKDHMGFPMILVPIISFLLSMLQTFISNQSMRKQNPDAAKQMGAMNIMLWIMPFMSLWIAFTVPAGAGFYWAISYAFGIGQTFLLNKLYDPARLRAEAEEELKAMEKASKKQKSKPETEVVTVIDENGKEETLSQKEINRRKLAEARRADALKYGEEYHEDSDDDN